MSVKVFDVSNPSAPVYLQDIVTTNTTKVHQITVRNKGASTILYTSGWGGNDNSAPSSPGQTDIWDVSNVGTQPAQWLGRIYSGYNSHSSYPTPDGNTLVVCREIPGGDVKLYDITNPATIPTNAAPLVTLTPASMGIEADIPHNPVVVSNYLFLSWYQNGIQIFDISDRTKPVRLGFFDTFPSSKTARTRETGACFLILDSISCWSATSKAACSSWIFRGAHPDEQLSPADDNPALEPHGDPGRKRLFSATVTGSPPISNGGLTTRTSRARPPIP